MTREVFFECHNLSKNYGEKKILDNISFHLEQGEVICLLGPSGCGKSTLLRCIAGLENMNSGDLFLEGLNINEKTPESRPIVMMFQHPLLFPHLTVLENTIYGLKSRKIKKGDKIQLGLEMLEKMELEAFANVYPFELSVGQQQRVALARALMVKPKLILLDEPFSSLDAQLKVTLRSWIKTKLKETTTTAIFVTHDKEEAMLLSDRMVIISKGKIQQIGSPTEIYENPKTPFVAEFVSEGIIDEKMFIPLSKMQLHEKQSVLKKNDHYYYEGTVGSVFFKGGQKFYQIEIMKLAKEVVVIDHKELAINEKVYLCIDKNDVLYFS